MKDYISLLIFYAIISSSCATQNKFDKLADKHPEWLAEKCIIRFPNETQYIKGKDSIITRDSLRVDTVTVEVIKDGKVVKQRIPCPECKCTERTIYRTDTTRIVDSAKVYLANKAAHETKLTLIVTEHDRDKYKRQRNNLIGVCVVLVCIGALLIFRPKIF